VDREALQIRSYRVIFDLERRIYRVDRWRLPVSWGVPLRSLGYGAAALLAVLLAHQLPLLGDAIRALPAPVRLLFVPGGIAYALTAVRVDGRPAHTGALALARHWLGPRWVAAFESCGEHPGSVFRFDDLTLSPDEGGPRLRRARVAGPATVLLRYPGRGRVKGRRLWLEQASERAMYRGKVVRLQEGQRLELAR
jgi:hypothetical protein